MLAKRKQRLAATALCLLVMSCGRDAPTSPGVPEGTTGSLEVIVQTSGGDPDNDGYGLYVDSTLHMLPVTQQPGNDVETSPIDLVIPLVPVGTHMVKLDRIAGNCVLDGANPRPSEIAAGQKTVVTLTVTCLATGMEVGVHTTGFDNPPSYALVVDGRFAGLVGANDSSAVTRVPPGSHVLTLGIRSGNCDVANGNQVTLTVANRSIVPVSFDVSCAHAVRMEKIAYAVDTLVDGINGTWIVLINPDGSGTMPLVDGDQPSWSPDGTKLAYSNTFCPLYAQYYGDSCTGGIRTIDPEHWISAVMPNASSGLDPAWAPVGETIAFTRCCTHDFLGRVYFASADQSAPDSSVAMSTEYISDPSWSPDGQHIVVSCNAANGQGTTTLCIARRDSTGVRRLALGAGDISSPAWSPDGKRIAFTRAPGYPAKVEVVLMDVNTLEVTTLTEGSEPAWSPDGTKLLVVNSDGLYVINADGSNKTRIVQGGVHAPAWRP